VSPSGRRFRTKGRPEIGPAVTLTGADGMITLFVTLVDLVLGRIAANHNRTALR
jgi:hypothetical protein